MRHTILATIAAVVTAAIAAYPATVWAQSTPGQVKLTEKHVEGFIAAQKDMSVVVEKLQGAASRSPNPRYEAELEAVTKKYGFKNFAEYAKVSRDIAKQAVDEFYPQSALQVGDIRGLDMTLRDALQYKFITSAMTPKDVEPLFDVLYKPAR